MYIPSANHMHFAVWQTGKTCKKPMLANSNQRERYFSISI